MVLSYLRLIVFVSIIAVCSCSNENPTLPEKVLTEIESPVVYGAEPNLFVSDLGDIYLTWIEYLDDTTDALYLSVLENGVWESPKQIAAGSDWFVNWADFPSLAGYNESKDLLVAHWLQKSAQGTYDYDVHITQSEDAGDTWSESFIPHRDSISAEHGFVTLLPIDQKTMFATWLDGRNTKSGGHDENGHAHHGAMTLRCATFNPEGQILEEYELDNRVCDCCQTDAAMLPSGPVVVYRDRTNAEIRDIYIVRQVNGVWTEPKAVHNDNWNIAGCPVNGPAIDAQGNKLAVAWYTGAEDKQNVLINLSDNGGAKFGKVTQLNQNQAIGRVDVEYISEDEVLATWLEKKDSSKTHIEAAIVHQNGQITDRFTLTESSESRSSGFPILAKTEKDLILAWTVLNGDSTSVKTAIINY
jgi:hypothetical protein